MPEHTRPAPRPADLIIAAAGSTGPSGSTGQSAHDEVVELHSAAVLHYSPVFCRDLVSAQELTRSAFARAFRKNDGHNRATTAWRPFLLAEVRRTAGDWARADRAELLHPEFRRWYADLVAAFGTTSTIEQAEDSSLLLSAFQSLPEHLRTALWHVSAEEGSTAVAAYLLRTDLDGATAAASMARDRLAEAHLRLQADRAPSRECRHYSRMLGAIVRGTNQRVSEDLKAHLATCGYCAHARADHEAVNAGNAPLLRSVLTERLLLWGAAAYRTRPASPEEVPAGLHLAAQQRPADMANGPRPRSRRGLFLTLGTTVTAVVAIATTTAATLRLLPGAAQNTAASTPAPSPDLSAPSPGPTGPRASTTPSATQTPFTVTSGATIRLENEETGRCVEIPRGGSSFNALPTQAECGDGKSQQWKIIDLDGDAVELRNAASGLCLDIAGGLVKGTPLSQRPCASTQENPPWPQDQAWLLTAYPASGHFTLSCEANPKVALGLKAAETDSTLSLLASDKKSSTLRFVLNETLIRG